MRMGFLGEIKLKRFYHLKDFIKNEKEIRPDLNPCDVLFGSRTNASV
jgi:hypothetical protein